MIVIDTAHGHSKNVIKMLNKIKKFNKKIHQFVLEILLQVMQQNFFLILAQIS